MKKQLLYISLLGAISLTNCSGEATEESIESSLEEEISLEDDISESALEDQEMLNNLILSMPSPLETSFAIKSSGAEYNSSFLNPIENIEKYTSEGKKALNMGVYGTDLGYINIFEKQMHIVSYMSCLKSLAEDLNVGHFFDLEAIERMTSSANNMDSLIIESTLSYNEMDNFLREQNRGRLSVLMAIGAWAEGVHILSEVYEMTKNKDLRDKITEQGIVVETISSLVEFYAEDDNIKPIKPLMDNIITAYEKVEINEVVGETKMEEIDGELQIIETGYTEFSISDENLSSIIDQIRKLRMLIIE